MDLPLFPLVFVLALVPYALDSHEEVGQPKSGYTYFLFFEAVFGHPFFFKKSQKIGLREGGWYPPGGKKRLSGGLGPKIPSKTRFGGDFKAKLGVKILLLC